MSTGGMKAGYATGICLVPWKWGQRRRRGPQLVVCYRAGCEAEGLGLEDMRDTEDLKLASLVPVCFSNRLDLGVPRTCLLHSEAKG